MDNIRILNGNELIIQGALESGFALYTGYPGSPLADYFNILYARKKEFEAKGIQVVIANSEANAAAMAGGSKQAGRDCLVGMKSMGLHVASDALSVGNFANPGPILKDDKGEDIYPGTVIAVGDDPWSMSTSTPADSRYIFKHLHIPFLEPSNPQELKDWVAHALWLSKKSSVYQGLLLTTFLAEGGGRVEIGQEKKVSGEKTTLDPADFDLSKNVMVPPNSLYADTRMISERFPKVKKALQELNLDQKFGSDSKIGIISSGVIFETLKQVMEEGDYLDHFSLYKLACSYPLVSGSLSEWLKTKDHVIVVEEKRGFLEAELKAFCHEEDITLKIHGKEFSDGEGFPAHGGLSYEIVASKLKHILELLGETGCKGIHQEVHTPGFVGSLPRRLPTFCPGCPHRETLSLLKDLRKTLKSEDVDLISHGDVGCYSLSFLEPFKEMHNISAMGQGGALGAGLDMFTTNPSVVLMGDSTFFHSGITDISNSVQAEHNITYIILDNDNTAMTGHQMTPASGQNVQGHIRPRQSILNAVYAMGVNFAQEVNPSDRYFYKSLLQDVIKKDGVKVIVSNKECSLTFQGRKKREERQVFKEGGVLKEKTFFQVNTDACEDCRICVDATGCPGLSQTMDAYGSKVWIDPQICVSDGYCTKMKACPSFEKVIVKDFHPTKYKDDPQGLLPDLSHLKTPKNKTTLADIASGTPWRMVVTGVGGSGVTTISRVIAEAAKEMDGRSDLSFKFMDQKGLAQRNGNVTGHLCIHESSHSSGAVTPMGRADLLLSPDLLDGSRQTSFLKKDGVCLFDKSFQIPLSIMLDKGFEKKPMSAKDLQHKLTHEFGERLHMFSLKKISENAFGKSVYANAMLLGVAFQKGELPFSLDNMLGAFERAVPKAEVANNILAFHMGRFVAQEGDKDWLDRTKVKVKGMNKESLLKKSFLESLLPWQNKKVMEGLYDQSLAKLASHYPEMRRGTLAQYIHDLYVYDRGAKASEFVQKAGEIKHYYADSFEHQQMALRILAKTFFVKDEVFVAHAMISPMKKRRDELAYHQLGKSYRIERMNRPCFTIMGKKIEFDINPKDWMLKIMRHMRLIRVLLSDWHCRERKMAYAIREELLGSMTKLSSEERYQALSRLDNVKGYREVRYEAFEGIIEA